MLNKLKTLIKKTPQKRPVSSGNQIHYDPQLTKLLIQKKAIKRFMLFDVGVSGGISSQWDPIGEVLEGVGFDPLIKECERLRREEKRRNIQYVSCFIVSENEEIDTASQDDGWGCRTSSWIARNGGSTYIQENFNHGKELLYAEERISLDRFCRTSQISSVDFLKVDTDGYDYRVLRGAEKLLDSYETLGAHVECNFAGEYEPHSNCLRNIDGYLASKGFKIFDLTVNRYTKKELPGIFQYDLPAQSLKGQACWGDVLFLRDFVAMKDKGLSIPVEAVIKMLVVMEIFGLLDCTAELLIHFETDLSPFFDIPHALDLLAKQEGLYQTYQMHKDAFAVDHSQFFPDKE